MLVMLRDKFVFMLMVFKKTAYFYYLFLMTYRNYRKFTKRLQLSGKNITEIVAWIYRKLFIN